MLTYTYDSGGNLRSASGEKAVAASGQNHRYQYLHSLFYDKFEQRALVKQGNGVTTAYTYDDQTRRLNNLTAQKSGGKQFQNLFYTYDKVGNVTELANQVAVPPPNKFGGPTLQHFEYDDLYRLTSAFGTFQYSPQKTHRYDLAMSYDSIYNITHKTQAHAIQQPSGVPITQKKTTYDFAYAYDPTTRPHAPIHIGERAYTYDANGNQTGWTHDQNGTRRTIVWDEENRIQSLFDNGHEKTYKYDDQGQRIIKRGPQGETVYVNQFFTSRPGANGTKHIYAGTTRIASKLMRQNVPNANPAGKTPFEKDLYFYHPDHLGTSNYITDLNAKLYEHLEYFPFGEAWVEENSNTQRTPYLFTAKELDEETGLYYFGARYYDPRTSVWQSGDPILSKYLSGKPSGGVFNPSNLGLYSYSQHNPLTYLDPNGKHTLSVHRLITETAFTGEISPAHAMSQRAIDIVVRGNFSMDTCPTCQTNAPAETNKHGMRGVVGFTTRMMDDEYAGTIEVSVPILQTRAEAITGTQAVIDERINAAVAEAARIPNLTGPERADAIVTALTAIGEATHPVQDRLQHDYAPYTANGLGSFFWQNPITATIHGARDAILMPDERGTNIGATLGVYDTFRQRLSERVGAEAAAAIDTEIREH